MPRDKLHLMRPAASLVTAAALLACSQVIGLDKLSVDNSAGSTGGANSAGSTGGANSAGSTGGANSAGSDSAGSTAGSDGNGCKSNAECTDAATLAAGNGQAGAGATANGDTQPAVCLKSTGQCVNLLSVDCTLITGNYLDDQAIIIGSLFQTQNNTATQNIPRRQSATMAVEEVNAAGGIQSSTAGTARPLVMVSCDSSIDLVRAATHLVDDIKVPAIVGPNTSQDTIDVSNKVTIKAGVAVVSPTAVAASIADLLDNDLTWLMIPSDDQRAQLMLKQINDVETVLKVERGKSTIKLSIIYRNDALGTGTRTSLDRLILNGKPLSDPSNAGSLVHIAPYDYKQADQNAIVAQEVAFAPDIVVLAGTAESITKVMTPLEQQWSVGTNRPYYFIIDPSKGPELLSAVSGNDDLRIRVRGTGTTPAKESVPIANTFNLDYFARYGSAATASGSGACYDASYAIAYALTATKDETPSGASVAKGLRMLAGGSINIGTGTQDLLAAFQRLASGGTINANGTACPLDWDANGTVKGGNVEMWCIGKSVETPVFQGSGLVFDIRTQTYSGEYVQCN